MTTDDAAEEAIVRILVADGSVFQRRLTTEMLRAIGRVQVDYAEDLDQCLMAIGYCQPDVLIADWDIEGGSGLTLVKRIRAGDAGAEFEDCQSLWWRREIAPMTYKMRGMLGLMSSFCAPSTQTLLKRVAKFAGVAAILWKARAMLGLAGDAVRTPTPMMGRVAAFSMPRTSRPMHRTYKFAKAWRVCIASVSAPCSVS